MLTIVAASPSAALMKAGAVVFLDNRPPNVEAARDLGIHGLLHAGTPASIAAIEALLGQFG
jgi:hypothetical protein